ncbi:hypothetical protein NQ315_007280 [Exocentrus adspersus]|uniref:Uncharacterized protein n=1 Tax=Exocentrus adspersus TaxID=1586481 RepID=A0AAV8WDS5_9CUCU|nr:hypothetical protein NQ315_007280 [Exocentrus adspersus]
MGRGWKYLTKQTDRLFSSGAMTEETCLQICMLLDVFADTDILSMWLAVYLALPILASSAVNPWVYGYRNSELRCAVRRVVDDLLTAMGFTYRSHQTDLKVIELPLHLQVSDPIAPSAAATAGDAGSFINHVQRDDWRWKPDGDFLLVPIAKPESSGVVSDCYEAAKVYGDPPKIVITSDAPRLLRGSRSMVESFAISRGSDILIITGTDRGDEARGERRVVFFFWWDGALPVPAMILNFFVPGDRNKV